MYTGVNTTVLAAGILNITEHERALASYSRLSHTSSRYVHGSILILTPKALDLSAAPATGDPPHPKPFQTRLTLQQSSPPPPQPRHRTKPPAILVIAAAPATTDAFPTPASRADPKTDGAPAVGPIHMVVTDCLSWPEDSAFGLRVTVRKVTRKTTMTTRAAAMMVAR